MGDVIEFPKNNNGWKEVKKGIKENIKNSEVQISNEGINYICNRMKKFYLEFGNEEFNASFNLSKDLSEQFEKEIKDSFQDIKIQINQYTNKILLERLQLEVKLYVNGYTFEEYFD